MTDQIQTDYLDGHKSVQAETNQWGYFNGSNVVSTTYLSKVNMLREDAFMVQEQFLLNDQSKTIWTLLDGTTTEQFKTIGTLLDGTDCKICLGSRATQSVMSKDYYLRNKSLHLFHKFSSKVRVINFWNGARGNILFIILIIEKFKVICLKFKLWLVKYMLL